MKIILASIAFLSPYTFNRRYLGLGYIHAHALSDAALRDKISIDHRYYDFWAYSHADIAGHILESSPDLVGFGCYVWNTLHVIEIAARIKAVNPNIKIILGGPDIRKHYLRILKENPALDYIAVGEGEETFRELLHALLESKDVSEIAGLAQRGPKGPVLLRERKYAKNLDIFASPFLAGVMEVDELTKGAFFQTSRGCPCRCTYCNWGRETPYAEFSVERVEAEIQYFQSKGAKGLFCVDSNFNQNNKRAIKILNAMEKHALKAGVWVETQPNLLDEGFMKAVSRTHLTYVGLGIQTTNPKAMEHIKRKWKPEKIGKILNGFATFENCYPG
ncbi:MAG: cobalamin-dependent protein, partial [Planctomycetota bacterium]